MTKHTLDISINLLKKAQQIMNLYSEDNLEILLDHIHHDLIQYKEVNQPSISSTITAPSDGLLEQLRSLDGCQLAAKLDSFTKPKLIELAKSLGLKITTKTTKQQVVDELKNYFSFIHLNKRMENRLPQQ